MKKTKRLSILFSILLIVGMIGFSGCGSSGGGNASNDSQEDLLKSCLSSCYGGNDLDCKIWCHSFYGSSNTDQDNNTDQGDNRDQDQIDADRYLCNMKCPYLFPGTPSTLRDPKCTKTCSEENPEATTSSTSAFPPEGQ